MKDNNNEFWTRKRAQQYGFFMGLLGAILGIFATCWMIFG